MTQTQPADGANGMLYPGRRRHRQAGEGPWRAIPGGRRQSPMGVRCWSRRRSRPWPGGG